MTSDLLILPIWWAGFALVTGFLYWCSTRGRSRWCAGGESLKWWLGVTVACGVVYLCYLLAALRAASGRSA